MKKILILIILLFVIVLKPEIISAQTITCGTPSNFTYCYTNNDVTTWSYTASGTDPLAMTFNSGQIEAGWDDITIYDGPNNSSPVLFTGDNGGPLAGLTIEGTGTDLFFEVNSDGSVSCTSGAMTLWDWDVYCVSCPSPSAASTSGITTTSADLSWTTGGSVLWVVEYGPEGFVLGSGQRDTVSTNPYTITGLSPFSTYDWYVIDFCGLNDLSSATGPNTFTTPSAPIVCGTTTNVTHCYTNNDATTWYFTRDVGGTDPLAILFNSGDIEDGWDDITIYDGANNSAPVLFTGDNGGDLSGLLVEGTGADLFFEINSDGSVSCGSGSFSNQWDFDVFCLSCPTPSGETTSAITMTTADIAWTSGGAMIWVVEYGPTGFALGTGQRDTISTNPYTLTGLTASTIYDWYIIDFCGLNDLSYASGPNTFTTPNQPIVCGTIYDFTHCYSNNDATTFAYTRAPGGTDPLAIYFTAGWIEASWDNINIYDGPNNSSPVLFSGDNGGDLTGLLIEGTGADLFFEINSDGFVSCATGSQAQWEWTVFCLSCPSPSAASTSGITGNSATLSWTTGGSNFWVVEYGPTGFTPGQGDSTLTTASNPLTLSWLDHSTEYDWYVKDFCGIGDSSWIVGPITFGTTCLTQIAPYYQNYDGPLNSDPHCWSSSGSEPWLYYSSTGTNTPAPAYGVANTIDHTSGNGNFAWIDGSDGGITQNELISPTIDFSGLTQGIVGCWIMSNNTTNGAQNSLSIEAFDGANWIPITTYSGNNTTWTRVWGIIPNTIPTTTTFRLVQIESTTGTGSVFNNDLLIDDFFVEEAPTCFSPTNLADSIISPTLVDLSWTTGGASAWIIEYGAPGFIPGFGNGTTVHTNTNPTTVTVMSGQEYDWYVQDSCSETNISWHSYSSNFTMPYEVICGMSNNYTYCYQEDENNFITYQTVNTGSNLHLTFNAGQIGNAVDFRIYDGPDNTYPMLFTTTGNSNMTGLEFTSTGPIFAFYYDATNFLSSDCNTPLDFDINCCVNSDSTYNLNICTNTTYTLADGEIVSSAGTFNSVIPNMNGCDSMITYEVNVITDTVNITDIICSASSYTLPDGTVVSSPGFYQQTILNSMGCDSTINLTLSPASPTAFSINVNICFGESYTLPDASVENTSGTYVLAYTNSIGCDSAYAVNLNVYNNSTETQNVTICNWETYTLPDGVVVSSTDTYTSYTTNMNNCSHIVTTNLTVAGTSFSEDSIYLCGEESYTLLNGNTVTNAGEYNVNISNSNGCDSIVTIFVTRCEVFTGLIETTNSSINLFPNPTSEFINIEFDSNITTKEFNVYIVNSLGQKIINFEKNKSKNLHIDVSEYSNGIYYLVAKNETDNTVKRFVVSK